MENALNETNRRRKIQSDYNEAHGIVPRSITKKVYDVIHTTLKLDQPSAVDEIDPESMSIGSLEKKIEELKKAMYKAAADLSFEEAAMLRDEIMDLRKVLQEVKERN